MSRLSREVVPIHYFSPEQRFNAWVVSDLVKQVFRRHTRCPDGIKELTAFAEDTFHINIDFVFSIIINIGDIESVLPTEIENKLGSYLTALQPVITSDMLHSSKTNAYEYLEHEKNTDVYRLFY